MDREWHKLPQSFNRCRQVLHQWGGLHQTYIAERGMIAKPECQRGFKKPSRCPRKDFHAQVGAFIVQGFQYCAGACGMTEPVRRYKGGDGAHGLDFTLIFQNKQKILKKIRNHWRFIIVIIINIEIHY